MNQSSIRLESVDATLPALRIDASQDHDAVIGRQSDLPHCVPHSSVSRQHCRLDREAESWYVTDLGSLNGTWIDGQRLNRASPARLRSGSMLRLGEVDFIVHTKQTQPSVLSTINNAADRVSVVPQRPAESARVLDILLHYAAMADGAETESELADAIARAAMSVGQFSRVAVVKPQAGNDAFESVTMLARFGQPGDDHLSRTLLREAVEQQKMVRLDSSPTVAEAVSIVGMQISSALCVPILVGTQTEALLYADLRENRPGAFDQAAPICETIARLGGLGLASLMRAASEQKRLRLQADVDAARTVQQRLLPPPHGTLGPIEYALTLQPGRGVAGDLIGMTPVSRTATAFFLGDVSGKGLAAGLLMSRVQAELEALLATGFPLVDTVNRVNTSLVTHSAEDQFVTLWIGVIDTAAGTLRHIDAGHGYAASDSSTGPFALFDHGGGIPLGIDPAYRYSEHTSAFTSGRQLCIFSDGPVEQTNTDGVQFGVDRLLAVLDRAPTGTARVEAVADAIEAWAGRSSFDDDLSVLTLKCLAQP